MKITVVERSDAGGGQWVLGVGCAMCDVGWGMGDGSGREVGGACNSSRDFGVVAGATRGVNNRYPPSLSLEGLRPPRAVSAPVGDHQNVQY